MGQRPMGPFFISNRLRPVNTGSTPSRFFRSRLRNLAVFFVPGVNWASPISTQAKTVDLPGVRGEYAIS